MMRRARLAGSWYPADEDRLLELTGSGRGSGDLVAGVLPHAGLMFSARLTRLFFDRLDKSVERLLIVSPSHYYALGEGMAVTSSFTSAQTPLGEVAVRPMHIASAIVDDSVIAKEHGLEVFLPFVKARGGLEVSFLVLGRASSYASLLAFEDVLCGQLDGRTALVASSDFTHYGARFGYQPYGHMGALEKVRKHDLSLAGKLARGEVDSVFPHHEETTVCGIVGAMATSLIAKEHGLDGRILGSDDSASILGEGDEDFVSYVAIGWGGSIGHFI